MLYTLTDRLIEIFFTGLARCILWIQPALPVICATIAWGLVAAIALSLIATTRRSIANVRKLHQVPCSRCVFSTSDYRLKCSVHPTEAFSEQAIGCYDFEAENSRQLVL